MGLLLESAFRLHCQFGCHGVALMLKVLVIIDSHTMRRIWRRTAKGKNPRVKRIS
jgi:hypothetical protein